MSNDEKTMEYKAVRGSLPLFPHFERDVNDLISEGWKPLGGIKFTGGCCFQAMVRYATKGQEEILR